MKEVAKIHERCHGAVASQLWRPLWRQSPPKRLVDGRTFEKRVSFFQKIRFGAPFLAPVDLEEGPKITFSGIMLEKDCKIDT